MINYVAGFLVDKINNIVCLIKKTKPEWQAGRYNAIGGKVEFGETPIDAMQREFYEEAGQWIKNWTHRVTLTGSMYPNDNESNWRVYFFVAFAAKNDLDKCYEFALDKEEVIDKFEINDLLDGWYGSDIIGNIRWLLPLCLDESVEIAEVWEK